MLRTLQGHTSVVTSLAFSPDGTTLASASWDKTIRLWRVTDGAPLRTLTGHTDYVQSVAISPNGATLASGAGSGDRTIRLWRVADGVLLHTLKGRLNAGILNDVKSLVFSPDGASLVSGAVGNVQVWRVADGTLLRQLDRDFGHMDGGSKLALSPDGVTLALSSHYGTVRLWRVDDGVLLGILNPIPRWRIMSFFNLSNLSTSGHQYRVTGVAFSPDGATLALSSHDGTVRLWRVADAALLRTLTGHTDKVLSVAFSADGTTTVASGSMDRTVRLWAVQK